MAVVRLTLATPNPGDRERVEALLDELEVACANQPGYIQGFCFSSSEHEHMVGRVSVWRSAEEANRVALLDRVQAIRSQIHLHIQAGHIEALFTIRGTPVNVPLVS